MGKPDRAAVSYHTKWFKRGEHPVTGEEVILLEYVFEQNFPDPEYVRGLINDMNDDNSCVYIKELSRDSNSPDFVDASKGDDYPYGVVIAHEHDGEERILKCFSF